MTRDPARSSRCGVPTYGTYLLVRPREGEGRPPVVQSVRTPTRDRFRESHD